MEKPKKAAAHKPSPAALPDPMSSIRDVVRYVNALEHVVAAARTVDLALFSVSGDPRPTVDLSRIETAARDLRGAIVRLEQL